MEDRYTIITITGSDRVGKETQTKLLTEVLQPSKRLSAPDYDHWAGRIVRNILTQQAFSVRRAADMGPVHTQDKHPQILQLLHNINSWAKQEVIREGLKAHHWVMDRYIEDAYAYGLQDGCSLDYLLELNRRFIQSDVVIAMLGSGFPRPGEEPDINEKDTGFQKSVRDKYRALSVVFPHWKVIEADAYRDLSRYESITQIHERICGIVTEQIGCNVDPLRTYQVTEVMKQWEKPNTVTV